MNSHYKPLNRCRVSGSTNLLPVLGLGEQAMTGQFPATANEAVPVGPLQLVWCPESGLLQLAHSYNLDEMYGDNYGYRSGLNQSMVAHLTAKMHHLERFAGLETGDAVLDIGSNDATALAAYATSGIERTGMDPSGEKFRRYYPEGIRLVPDFFSAAAYRDSCAPPPKIVTSIAMFYDLEDPIAFAREVESILAPRGVWHFEQSYLPAMLRATAYDTVCHEHLEYYSLGVVHKILDAAGMRLVDVSMNGINGGSFAVTAVRRDDPRRGAEAVTDWLLEQEDRMGLRTPAPYQQFAEQTFLHRVNLRELLQALKDDGKTILGYGASTKGNVLLQFCGIDASLLVAIVEVNPDKFGKVTPGTHIPIVSEADAARMNPDYYLVLPWHFREGIVAREAAFRARGGKLIFPLPTIEIV